MNVVPVLLSSNDLFYVIGMLTGSYLLVVWLDKSKKIMVGKLGTFDFEGGWYVYVGSALRGIDQRVQRHLRKSKKLHWHIDYFLLHTDIIDVFYFESKERTECMIADVLSAYYESVLGFGCSDCGCNSHLFFCKEQKPSKIIFVIDGMKKLKIETA